jgi:hypothetical protein
MQEEKGVACGAVDAKGSPATPGADVQVGAWIDGMHLIVFVFTTTITMVDLFVRNVSQMKPGPTEAVRRWLEDESARNRTVETKNSWCSSVTSTLLHPIPTQLGQSQSTIPKFGKNSP